MFRKTAAFLLAGLCLIGSTTVMADETSSFNLDPSVPVEVTGGQITGALSDDGSVAIYKGIPFAAPPVGDLRWKAPQPVESWEGVKECTEFGPVEYQPFKDVSNEELLQSQPWMQPYTKDFLVNEEEHVADEDCLYLNVWAPAGETEEKKPVIVYVHGGGFGEGSGAIKAYTGEEITRNEGVVYVSINYRFGIFGFLTTPELDAESENGTSGNYGLMDVAASLQWVHDNIAAFGGDPDNVTIVGQSAGGMAVEYMVASPLAKGLINRAVVLSGNAIGSGRGTTEKEALQAAFAEAYPDATLEDLRAASSEDLWNNYSLNGNVVVDGYVLTKQMEDTMKAGEQNPVDLLLSFVEGDFFTFFIPVDISTVDAYEAYVNENYGDQAADILAVYPAASDEDAYAMYEQVCIDARMMTLYVYAKLNEKMGKTAYIDYFTHTLPGPFDCGAFHTADVPYWNGALEGRAEWLEDIDYDISKVMQKYLADFAANGDPNGEGLTEWAAYNGEEPLTYLHIGDNEYEMIEMPADRFDFWMGYYADVLA